MEKDRYLEILLKQEVLQFGEFVTKSKRTSPYFFNTGRINSGNSISEVAKIYADLIVTRFGKTAVTLFGPAYKGIPLCVAVSEKLAQSYGRDVYYTFNRKEAKDHGEGGLLIGYTPKAGDEVIIVEDVLTSGISIGESLEFLAKFKVNVRGVAIGIDRQERGLKGKDSARSESEKKNGIKIESIINLNEIVDRLWAKKFLNKIWIDDALKLKIDAYFRDYCT